MTTSLIKRLNHRIAGRSYHCRAPFSGAVSGMFLKYYAPGVRPQLHRPDGSVLTIQSARQDVPTLVILREGLEYWAQPWCGVTFRLL